MKKPTLKSLLRSLAICAIALAAIFVIVKAGSINPPEGSLGNTNWKTLDDIYCKLTGCVPADHSLDSPDSPEIPTMHTTQDIWDETPDFKGNPGTAEIGDVKSGKTFYKDDVNPITGTLPTPPTGWSGNCVWKEGDVDCPADYPSKHVREVCSEYGISNCTCYAKVESGFYCNQGDLVTDISCTGSECTGCRTYFYPPGTDSLFISMNECLGICSVSNKYTYCCQ